MLTRFAATVSRHLGASRPAFLKKVERPALKSPAEPFEFAQWKE